MTAAQEHALFVGTAVWDVVVELPHQPPPDGRVVADEIVSGGGGPAATAAVAFARLGLPARLAASVGDDREGAAVRAALAADDVDSSLLRTVPGAATGGSVVLVDRSRDSRTICVRPGPLPSVTAADVAAASWLHVDHQGLAVVREIIEALSAGTPRPVISYDAGNLDPHRCPPWVDLYAPTLGTLRDLYGDRPTDTLLDAALTDGARWVVATDGARGVVAADASGHYRVAAHDAIGVRSTLGAGDVFHGALLAAFARDMDLPAATAYANAAAALSCRGLDGRSAIPDHDEALALAAHRAATPA